MKKERKHVYLDDRTKRLMIYLTLLFAAVFFAIQDPNGLWLSIGLSCGILYGLASDWIFNRKKKSNKEDNGKNSTEISQTVENKTEKSEDHTEIK